jgi:hypothetical protein
MNKNEELFKTKIQMEMLLESFGPALAFGNGSLEAVMEAAQLLGRAFLLVAGQEPPTERVAVRVTYGGVLDAEGE